MAQKQLHEALFHIKNSCSYKLNCEMEMVAVTQEGVGQWKGVQKTGYFVTFSSIIVQFYGHPVEA